jgi:succinyl-CoA synthetase alpha subunit
MEAELARWVVEHDVSADAEGERKSLPIVAFMAGRFMDEMPGMSFGHAGTIVEGKEDTTAEKIERLAAAGIAVAERIEDIPQMIRQKIGAQEGAYA